ncbi:MAG TPA: isocitrate/isopropylmalate family dehydrogenase [Candidatus Nitrosopelagicus sp.]|mgnify:FL=1|nr:isocitrate/isopropylmalate family dehydrogenase [Candidatus Nitrosopelagicus sp.]
MGKKAVVIKGDGIGPEIVESMVNILKECNLQAELLYCDAGSEQWEKKGGKDPSYIPETTMKALEECDTCFKGPTTTIPKPDAPRSVAVTLRQKFELFSNIRPVKTFKRLTPNRDVDFVCFREATEGLYTGVETQLTPDAAIAIRKITRSGCARFMESAMDWAKKYELNKIVAITKRNILKKTDGLFFEEVQNSLKDYPHMKLQEIYIDNMAQQLIINPEQFNNSVLVSTNLFMDIISELASGIVGSIGLIYSSNMGKNYAMFEAAHGSAPSFKGQNKVNPTATVLAGAWMADYLGEKDIRDAIFSATNQIINEGKYVTFDIGGNATTTQMSEQIITIAKSNLRK